MRLFKSKVVKALVLGGVLLGLAAPMMANTCNLPPNCVCITLTTKTACYSACLCE